jgi:alkaline phosphatase
MSKSAACTAVLALCLAGAANAQAVDARVPPVQRADSYFQAAQADLKARLAVQPRTGRAKNVILFVGDGMGVSTVTAARIYQGQKAGVDGESFVTAMDALPYSGLVKTYASDAQVSDSAPTATAMTTGVKTRNDVIGVDQTVPVGDCAAQRGHEVWTIFEEAESRGLATGVVSTARITHATPAATYAHVANRDWENDSAMPAAAKAAGCVDIARQLVEWPSGDGFEVVLGGGRAQFLPRNQADPEDAGETGLRSDGLDLTAEWRARDRLAAYVWNKAQFDAVVPGGASRLLGLFDPDHMKYEARRPADAAGEPSLVDMTVKAIQMLQLDPQGFVLMIESGRIDHAHHAGQAGLALDEAAQLDAAVRTAMGMVNLDETLIVVTADHSHNLSLAGYPRRGNPILGRVVDVDGEEAKAGDGMPYTTLSYANGPGAVRDGPRRNPANEDTLDIAYRQPALVPFGGSTHGGEDVAVRAIGPWAHLLTGTIEQNLIYHVMAHALQLESR